MWPTEPDRARQSRQSRQPGLKFSQTRHGFRRALDPRSPSSRNFGRTSARSSRLAGRPALAWAAACKLVPDCTCTMSSRRLNFFLKAALRVSCAQQCFARRRRRSGDRDRVAVVTRPVETIGRCCLVLWQRRKMASYDRPCGGCMMAKPIGIIVRSKLRCPALRTLDTTSWGIREPGPEQWGRAGRPLRRYGASQDVIKVSRKA